MATGVVSGRLRATYRAHVALVLAESLLLAGSAGIATGAATLARLPADAEGQAIAIALLVSALAGASWALERIGDRASVAREVDRQRGSKGAVLTAFQAESAGDASGLAQLLGSRVAHEVSTRSYARAAVRSSAPLLALPWLAIALWSLAVDSAGAPARDSIRSSSSASVAGHAAGIRSRAERLATTRELGAEVEAELARIAEDATALAAARVQPGIPASDTASELRDLERRLDVLQRSIPRETVTAGDGDGTMAGPDSGIDPGSDASMRDRTTPARPVELEPGAPVPGGPAPASGSAERGVLASRWWPPRYDAVVDRWVATRRHASGSPDR